MDRKIKFFNKINIRILSALLVLFTIAGLVVSSVNLHNLRDIYEKAFTEKVLLSNGLMATLIDADEVAYYVDLMQDQDSSFKQEQKEFNDNRAELLRLQEQGAGEEEQAAVMAKMQAFHEKMAIFKTDNYNETLTQIKRLKEAAGATYVYIVANTGVTDENGNALYTYIFDAEDNEEFISVDSDGLGTVSAFESNADEIYITKKAMDTADYYNAEPYGELYYAYAPILNQDQEVVAIVGTDLELGSMNRQMSKSMWINSFVFLAFIILTIIIIYVFINVYVAKPLALLTNTALQLADGNVYSSVPDSALKQNNELGLLASAIANMGAVYQNMIKSTGQLFEAANVGRLDVRNDVTRFKGDIAKVIEQINDTLDATTLYLNSIPECISIMSKQFELLFQNQQHQHLFGNITAEEFIRKAFPDGEALSQQQLNAQFADMLYDDAGVNAWIDGSCFNIIFKEIALSESAENSVLVIAIDITDLFNEKENAQAAAKTKSDFLSRMSHEMRTPMNAIIGMTKIAESTNDVEKLKYCLATIGASSTQLLGIINDVLDMSKIEAGKFELDSAPLNVEKMLMKVCNLVVDKTEENHQRLTVILDNNICLNYIGDELRLSQVLTNLLSNAVKFTPEHGAITLSVNETAKVGDISILRFSVKDTGIGLTEEQIKRLYTSFEQADGSISRRFGGTGLGLSISKNIVEKMNGKIWTVSEYGSGSEFIFEVELLRSSHQDKVIFDGIRPEDINLLLVEGDAEIRKHFKSITDQFGIHTDEADNSRTAIELTESSYKKCKPYDIIFLDYHMPGMDGLNIAKSLTDCIDKNTVIIMTSFLEWSRIESEATAIGINRYITKPLFPSAILDSINEVVGNTLKSLQIKTDPPKVLPDFSDVNILLAEDIDINQEIFIALLEDTKLQIDVVFNGIQAVAKFQAEPDKYDMIIMDIQMPEMDGYEATKTIRAMDLAEAKEIPIIAMTANAFKEDIERCLACGMNDHLSKPIDEKIVIEKLELYRRKTN